MKHRVGALIGPVAEKMWVSTFHSACVRILRAATPTVSAIRRRSASTTRPTPCASPATSCAISTSTPSSCRPVSVHAAISAAKNDLVMPDAFAEAGRQRLRAAGRPGVRRVPEPSGPGRRHGLRRPAHQGRRPVLERNPDVLEHYQRRFGHVLVDEYQDTNAAQNKLVLLLGREHRNVCVVGDSDQSIYQFRGADIRNILQFEEAFPDATVVVLEQNYRSTQTILDAANAVIANNLGRKPKELWDRRGTRRGDRPVPRQRRGRRVAVGGPPDRRPARPRAAALGRHRRLLPDQRPEPGARRTG